MTNIINGNVNLLRRHSYQWRLIEWVVEVFVLQIEIPKDKKGIQIWKTRPIFPGNIALFEIKTNYLENWKWALSILENSKAKYKIFYTIYKALLTFWISK